MWMINQLNEDLNDAFEQHYPPMSAFERWLYKHVTKWTVRGLSARVRMFKATTVVTERIIEYPAIFSFLPKKGSRILDIGCVSSRLPVQLASLGYEVHGLDVRPYRYIHHNLIFHQHDLFSWNPGILFDTVCLISVLEHFGLGGYGDSESEHADYTAVRKIEELMKADGQLIVSVPFGKKGKTSKHRIYDMAQLEDLFSNFIWRHASYFKRIGPDWVPAQHEELEAIISPPGIVNGVAILDLALNENS